jgi:hypothetical protein
MTALTLRSLWLNRTDTGEAISGPSGRDRGTTYTMDGERRRYANGRLRAVSTAGVGVEITRTMVALDYATKERLVSWLGVNVQLRDHRGNKWFGVFFTVAVSEYMRPDLYAAAITLLTTTTVEGV